MAVDLATCEVNCTLGPVSKTPKPFANKGMLLRLMKADKEMTKIMARHSINCKYLGISYN